MIIGSIDRLIRASLGFGGRAVAQQKGKGI